MHHKDSFLGSLRSKKKKTALSLGIVMALSAGIVSGGTMATGPVDAHALSAPVVAAPADLPVETPRTLDLTLGAIRGRMGSFTVNNDPNSSAGGAGLCDRYGYQTLAGTVYTTSGPVWRPALANQAGDWSYISRGIPFGDYDCASYIQPDRASALGFRTNDPGTVTAGNVFLVGTIRHNNFPISTNLEWVHGSIDLDIGGSADSFPFNQEETRNDHRAVAIGVGSGNGAYRYVGEAGYYDVYGYWVDGCRTGVALHNGRSYDAYASSVGCYSYVGQGNGAYSAYANTSGGYGVDAYGYTANIPAIVGVPNQTPNSRDVLTITRTTAARVVISNDGIPYRLVLRGFLASANGTCPAVPPANSVPTNQFVTAEGKASYGCLYGSFNQERDLRISKTALAEGAAPATVPAFRFSNTEALPSLSANSFGPLSPTLGPTGTATSTSQKILVGLSNIAITEAAPSPLATADRSGWTLTGLQCTNGIGEAVAATYDLKTRTINLDSVTLANSVAAVPITCAFTNTYTAKAKLTLVKAVAGVPAGMTVDAKSWTLSATNTSDGTIVDGVTGAASVTSRVLPVGTYRLAESEGPLGFAQTGLTCKDAAGAAVPVTNSQVALADGADVTCTFTNTFTTGSFEIVKEIQDPTRGYTGAPGAGFPIAWSCGDIGGKTFAGTLDVVPGTPAVVNGIPVGATCVVTEEKPTIPLNTTSHIWVDPVISPASITVSGSAVARVVVTNRVSQVPTFAVSKANADGGTNAIRNADGSYDAVWTVVVRNTSISAGKIDADVTDRLDLPAGVDVQSITVTEGEGAPVTPVLASDGTFVIAQAGSGVELAGGTAQPEGTVVGGGERTFTVRVHFAVDSAVPAFDAAEFQCGETSPTGDHSGLFNAVDMAGDTDGPENNFACQNLEPKLRIEKTLTTGAANAQSNFAAEYTIVVTNDGALAQNTGEILDRLGFAPGLVIGDVWISQDAAALGGAGSLLAPIDGNYLVTNGVVVQPGSSVTFHVRMQVTVDPTVEGWSEEALTCATDSQGVLVPGRGLYNNVSIAEDRDSDGVANNSACGPVNPDSGKRSIDIVKVGTQGELAGAQFELYRTDPSADGAEPIANGVVVDPANPARFTTAPLEINRDYWLIETKAPVGHNLLPGPVRFRLEATTIAVLGEPGETTLIQIGASEGIQDSMTVRDTVVGNLPLSGGAGLAPTVFGAMILIGGAAASFFFARRRHS